MNTDIKKNYRTLTKCDNGKLSKVIEYKSGAKVEIPITSSGEVRWFDDTKLLKDRVPHYRLEELQLLCGNAKPCEPDIYDDVLWIEITSIDNLPDMVKHEFESIIYKLLNNHYIETHELIPQSNIEIDMCIKVRANSLIASTGVFNKDNIDMELYNDTELFDNTELFPVFRSYFFDSLNQFVNTRLNMINHLI